MLQPITGGRKVKVNRSSNVTMGKKDEAKSCYQNKVSHLCVFLLTLCVFGV